MRRLVVNFARIGDLVMSMPVLQRLGKDAEIHLLCRAFGRPLFRGQPIPHAVHVLQHPNQGRNGIGELFFGGERKHLGKALTQIGFDEVYLYAEERPHIRRWISKHLPQAKILIFSGSQEANSGNTSKRHYSEVNRQNVLSVGISDDDFDPIPRLLIDAKDAHRAETWMHPFGEKVVGLQIGTQRTDRARWWRKNGPNLKSPPIELWREIILGLAEDPSISAILLHGSPTEDAMIQKIHKGLPLNIIPRVHTATRSLPLDLVPAVLARHSGFISADTGPAHIAAAVGCPLLVFFGPSDREFYRMLGHAPVEVLGDRPPCAPCLTTKRYKQCCDNICLNRLKITDVMNAWKNIRNRKNM